MPRQSKVEAGFFTSSWIGKILALLSCVESLLLSSVLLSCLERRLLKLPGGEEELRSRPSGRRGLDVARC